MLLGIVRLIQSSYNGEIVRLNRVQDRRFSKHHCKNILHYLKESIFVSLNFHFKVGFPLQGFTLS